MSPSLARVLVVDDEPQVAALLRDVMVDFGYEVATALSGPDALSLAARYRPDVVLLDLLMPGMSGEVALEHLSAFDPTIPIIVVSGNQDEDVARATLADGAFDYVTKPFHMDALERVLAAAIVERDRRQSHAGVITVGVERLGYRLSLSHIAESEWRRRSWATRWWQ